MGKSFLFKRSAVTDKIPEVSGMTIGELFINYASGDGKSFISTLKADNTVAQFMEKSYGDNKYAEKDIVDQLDSKLSKVDESVSALTEEIIDKEFVVAQTLNTINQSAGFDENGNSTLGMSLTDAIKQLQDNSGGSNETLNNIQNQIDNLNSNVSENTSIISGLTEDIEEINDKLNNIVTNDKLIELSGNVTTNTNSIADLQDNLDKINLSLEDYVKSEDFENTLDDINIKFNDYALSGNVETLSGTVVSTVNTVSTLEANVTEIGNKIDNLDQEIDQAISSLTDTINTKVSSAYIYKGSVSLYSELPTDLTSAETGYIYNVEGEHENHPAGTNWAWDGEKWDALAGIVDLSNYITTENFENIQNKVDNIESNYIASATVVSALTEVYETFNDYATNNKIEELSGSVITNVGNIEILSSTTETLQTEIDELSSKIDVNKNSISALTEEIIDKEFVVAQTLNTINQSAGFDENGNSTLGMSLTDAILELKDADSATTETIEDITTELDNLNNKLEVEYWTSAITANEIKKVDDKLENFATTEITDALSGIVSSHTESISGLSATTKNLLDKFDELDNELHEEYWTSAVTTEKINIVDNKLSGFTASAATYELSGSVITNYITSATTYEVVNNLQVQIDDLSENINENANAISGLTEEIINNEFVVAQTLNTINQSAGFDENGNSTLGMSLTDAVTDLRTNTDVLSGAVNTIQESFDNLNAEVEETISSLTNTINTKISSVYAYKGSVSSYSELPSDLTNENKGFVYNVEGEHENHPAGTNWAWDGEKWDALAGTVDLSIYTTTAVTNNLQEQIDNVSSSKVSKTGDTMTGDLTVPNVKADNITISPSNISGRQDGLILHNKGTGGGEGLKIRWTSASYPSGSTLHAATNADQLYFNDSLVLTAKNYSDSLAGGTVNGKFGINNPNPQATFQVYGTTYLRGDVSILSESVNNNNSSGKLRFGGHYDYEAGAYIQGINVDTYGRKRLSFFTTNAESTTPSWVEAMTILPTGTVAIGSDTADEKLHVHGNVKATSFIGNLTGNADSATKLRIVDYYNSIDLNTILEGGGVVHNYSLQSYWVNAPQNPQYGSCVQFQAYDTTEPQLSGQLFWDVNHKSTTDCTRSLWWRAADDNGWTNSKWHQIVFSDVLNNYLSLTGGTINASGRNQLSLQSSTNDSATLWLGTGMEQFTQGAHLQYKYSDGKLGLVNFSAMNNSYSGLGGIFINANNRITVGDVNASVEYDILHTGNYSSYALSLSGGEMTDGARIWPAVSALYIGRSDNAGWVYMSDMCSQSGVDYWNIYTNGKASFANTITAANFITTSDRRVKKNIVQIEGAKKSLELNFYEFDYVNNDNHSAGHIAQEVKEVLPEFVHGNESETEHLSIDYTGLHSMQIKALIDEINSLKKENEELKKSNNELNSRIDKIEELLKNLN